MGESVANVSSFVERLLTEEIRRHVAEAIRDGGSLPAAERASDILKVYPACGLSHAEISNRVILAAAKAGVPVEMGPQSPKAAWRAFTLPVQACGSAPRAAHRVPPA
jgi:hypothetical protein